VWTNESTKILGITFTHNPNIPSPELINNLKLKLEKSFQRWRPLIPTLSYKGRKIIINTFVTPRLWHFFQVLPFSRNQIAALQKTITDFFWCGKKHWLTYKHLYMPVSKGGLGLTDLYSKLQVFRVTQACKYLSHTESTNDIIMTDHYLKMRRKRNLSWQNFFITDTSNSCKYTSKYLNQVFEAWSAFSPASDSFPAVLSDCFEVPLTNNTLTNDIDFSVFWKRTGHFKLGHIFDGTKWKDFADTPYPHQIRTELERNIQIIKNKIQKQSYGKKQGPTQKPTDIKITIANEDIHITKIKTKRRHTYNHLLDKIDSFKDILPCHWNNDPVYWTNFFRIPTLGKQADISWRLAKNRLADSTYLNHIGVTDSTRCCWCSKRGTTRHIIIECQKTDSLWALVRELTKVLLKRSITVRDITNGVEGKNAAVNLANYLLSEAKSIAYGAHISHIRDDTNPDNFAELLKKKIRKRITIEYWDAALKENWDKFTKLWTYNDVLCKLTDQNELNIRI
jgi:hypothetical protein